jgi:hypothetical protein
MKQTIYLRVGKHVRGGKPKVAAGTKPSDRQLADSAGNPMPTIAFAVDVNIPDEMFRTAQRVVAELDISADNVQIPVTLTQP